MTCLWWHDKITESLKKNSLRSLILSKKTSKKFLTNTHINQENVPLFVFETEQKNQREELGEGYIWEEPGQMRSVLGTYEVEGVPFF